MRLAHLRAPLIGGHSTGAARANSVKVQVRAKVPLVYFFNKINSASGTLART